MVEMVLLGMPRLVDTIRPDSFTIWRYNDIMDDGVSVKDYI